MERRQRELEDQPLYRGSSPKSNIHDHVWLYGVATNPLSASDQDLKEIRLSLPYILHDGISDFIEQARSVTSARKLAIRPRGAATVALAPVAAWGAVELGVAAVSTILETPYELASTPHLVSVAVAGVTGVIGGITLVIKRAQGLEEAEMLQLRASGMIRAHARHVAAGNDQAALAGSLTELHDYLDTTPRPVKAPPGKSKKSTLSPSR